MSGASTLWPAMFMWALDNQVPLSTLVRAMSETPARLFGLRHRKGSLAPGFDADMIIVDPQRRQVVDMNAISPGVQPNPAASAPMAGWPQTTISRGEIVWNDGKVLGAAGRAQFVHQRATALVE